MDAAAKQVIPVETLPDPSAFGYSHVVRYGDTVAVAGQCGTDDSGRVVPGGIEPQTRRAFERLELALTAAGGTLADIVTMTVFITDIRDGRDFTRIRAEYLGSDFPASALIGCSALMPAGAVVEIQATAFIPRSTTTT
jgi:enamine deaminase RidA (YjgF/YER057c/UK114 family)